MINAYFFAIDQIAYLMRVSSLVPAECLEQAIGIMNLQDMIHTLTNESVSDVGHRICSTPLVLTSDGIKQIVQNLFLCCWQQRQLVKKVVDLLAVLMESEWVGSALGELKEQIAIRDVWHNRWYRHFLIYCINKKIITKDDFMNWIHHLPVGEDLFLVFCWFSPWIEAWAPDDLTQLWHLARDALERGELSDEVAYYVRRYEQMKERGWVSHRHYFLSGYAKSSLPYCLRYDDLELFRELTSNDNVQLFAELTAKEEEERRHSVINMRIEPSIFEVCDMVRHNPTLLQFAAFYQAKKCFAYLLSLKADITLKDDVGHTVTQFAVAGGCEAIIRICVVQKMDFTGTAMIAIQYYQFTVFEMLLHEGLEQIDLSTGQYPSSFHCSAMFNNIRGLLYCLEEGIDVNLCDAHGKGPLHYACSFERLDAILLLINVSGIDVNLQDEKGRTALHYAAKYHKLDAIRILLTDESVDLDVFDQKGMSPLGLAAKGGYDDIIYLLLSQNATVNVQTEVGLSPLHLAIKHNHISSIELLLSHSGVNVNIRDVVCFCLIAFPFYSYMDSIASRSKYW